MSRAERIFIIALTLVIVANAGFWIVHQAHEGLARARALEQQKLSLCELARDDEDACR